MNAKSFEYKRASFSYFSTLYNKIKRIFAKYFRIKERVLIKLIIYSITVLFISVNNQRNLQEMNTF